MITPAEFLMGRDKDFPLDMQQARNMADLLARVNWLLGTLEIHTTVNSGYRTPSINKSVGGAANSPHLMCQAIDLADINGDIALKILDHIDLLEACGLYMENKKYTKSWVHLQTRPTKNRVFNP